MHTAVSRCLLFILVAIIATTNHAPTLQAETYNGVGPDALKHSLKPRPELYDELLEAARTLPKVPAHPPSAAAAAAAAAAGMVGWEAGAGELRGHHVTLRVLRAAEDVGQLFEACNGSPT